MNKGKRILKILNEEVLTSPKRKWKLLINNEEQSYYKYLIGKDYNGLEIAFTKDTLPITYCKSFPPESIYLDWNVLDKIRNIINETN